MATYNILVVNNAPGCNDTDVLQPVTATTCTTYIVRLASNSNALGPFSVFVDSTLIGSGYTRTDMFNGVVVNLGCATPTPTPTPSFTPTPTPTFVFIENIIIVDGFFFSGSIGAGYSAVATYTVDTDVNVDFTSTLQTTTGSPITQSVTVTIPSGTISGFTQTFIDGLYVDLTQDAELSGFSVTVDGSTIYDFVSESGTTQFDVTPTPTPSVTETPTSTPTPSVTNTKTPTQTPTIVLPDFLSPAKGAEPIELISEEEIKQIFKEEFAKVGLTEADIGMSDLS